MKTVLVNFSPKQRFSNSGYFLGWMRTILRSEAVTLTYKSPGDEGVIFDSLEDAQTLVLAIPVYVSAIPSHVVDFLKQTELLMKEERRQLKVYAVANCGFYYSSPCAPVMKQIQCWCTHTGLEWCGGLGIGAGEMLGAIRILPVAALAVLLLSRPFAAGLLAVFAAFSFGMIKALTGLGLDIYHRKRCGEKYVTVSCCPWWLFVGFGDVFWVLRALKNRVPVWKMFDKERGAHENR